MNWRNKWGVVGAVIAVILLIVVAASMTNLIEDNPGDEILVTRDPIDGDYHWHTTPGMKSQRLGDATHYKKSSQAWFSEQDDQGEQGDRSLRARFNDKGAAKISLAFRWYMPLDEAHLTMLYEQYGNQKNIEHELIRTVAEKAVYNAGPLMSSMEAASEKRPDLLRYIEDMMANGVYKTHTEDEKTKDPISGEEVTVSVVKIVDQASAPEGLARQEVSPLAKFGIRVDNVVINGIRYDPEVQSQIDEQRKAIINVQTAKADAKAAEQRALTAVKEGEANAAKAKWAQEVIKATEVTKAEQVKAVAETKAMQQLEVAKLDAKAALQEKAADIARGEGEARRKQLVMNADGQLKLRLDTWLQAQEYYATAMRDYKGNWVPQIQMGESTEGSSGDLASNGATTLIDLLTVKTAKDLALDARDLSTKKTP